MITRRDFLIFTCGIASANVHATPDAMQEAIRGLTGGKPVQKGKVRLEVPPLIENGNSVVMVVTVDSPMTPADYVAAIHLFAPLNPLPQMLSAYLTPRAGRARVMIRARVAASQSLVAIAALSDGSYWSDQVDVVVTLAACSEEVK